MQVEYAGFLFMPGERVGPGRNGSACEVSEVLPIGDEAGGPSLTPSSITIPLGKHMRKQRQEQRGWRGLLSSFDSCLLLLPNAWGFFTIDVCTSVCVK